MIFPLRTFVLSIVLLLSTVEAQQKTYTVIKEHPIPDSVTSQFDTLILKKVDDIMVRQGWPKLKKGMLVPEVINLLNKPTRIVYSSFDESVTWYYGKRVVVFDNIKQTLRYWDK